MLLRSKFASLVGAMFLAGSAFAAQQLTCPSIDAIKAEGVSMAEQIAENVFVTYHISQYNTDSGWGFILAPFEGDNEEMVLDQSNALLSTMTAPGVPSMDNQGTQVCTYETGSQDVIAAAVKMDDQMPTPFKLKNIVRQLHK